MHRASICFSMALALSFFGSAAVAQNGSGQIKRIEPGVSISVHTSEAIELRQQGNRIYHAVVDQDLRDENGQVMIPGGSSAALVTRVAANGDLDLCLASVTIEGNLYVIKADPNRVQAKQDDSLATAVLDTTQRTGEIPAGSVVTFHLDRPMVIAVPDPGEPSVRRPIGG